VTAPTLVLWGEHDTFLPLPHGEAYARLIEGAMLRTIPAAGHLVPLEQIDAFINQVTDFLGDS
jgi:3-oxoadipate enol-lactonase